ncbi:MAG: cytochrome P450 [Bryobacteraceae bacterium]|nr:cytochrome P450 [Bryobacteraceae bacterium]
MQGPLGVPPGPSGWPLIGVLPAFRRDPAGFLLEVSRKYGDLSSFRMGTQTMFFLNRPESIEEVLVTGQQNFIKSRMLQKAKSLLGEGLLTSEGAFHLRQRRLAQPAFHRERLANYAATIVSCADRAQARWIAGQTLEMSSEMMRLTLAVVGLTLFSSDIENDATEVGQALTDVLSTFGTMMLPFSDLIRHLPIHSIQRAKRAQKLLDATIYKIIADRRKAGTDNGDLLSMLLMAADDGDGGMTDKQVRDEAMTLMLAGHETTANALTWTWYLLSQHPEAERKLHAEWNDVLQGRLPGFDDLPKLEYTERVLAESMRIYPPAWALGRMAVNQFRLYNYVIEPGSICIMSPYVMHRNPRYWPEPERFDPDRFTPEAKSGRPKYAYFPFGGGPRVCIGERFAWMEGVLILATIGQRWRLRLEAGHPVESQAQITLRPRFGMKMTAECVVV